MRCSLGPKKLRRMSRIFGRTVTSALVRGGSPHGCCWATFEGEPTQVWCDYSVGAYLNPYTGAVMPDLEHAVMAVKAGMPPPIPPTKERQEWLNRIQDRMLAKE